MKVWLQLVVRGSEGVEPTYYFRLVNPKGPDPIEGRILHRLMIEVKGRYTQIISFGAIGPKTPIPLKEYILGLNLKSFIKVGFNRTSLEQLCQG